jgi:hypothetical protein
MNMARGRKITDPEIVEMPHQMMAVVKGKGAPDEVFPLIMPALYGSVYTLKFNLKKQGKETFKVRGLRGRYPDASNTNKNSWTIHVGLPVPEDTLKLPQKVPSVNVELEKWEYGLVGQILHIGTYDKETPTIEKLDKYIKDEGYKICGAHEEEYLTSPDAKVVKTIIRYRVCK